MRAIPLVENKFNPHWDKIHGQERLKEPTFVASVIDNGWLAHVTELSNLWPKNLGGFTGLGKRRLKSPGVVGLMLVTLKHKPEKATGFWTGVFTGEQLASNDPRLTIRSKLNTATTGRGDSPLSAAAWCARAWNAYADDETRQILQSRGDCDVKINGTPYTLTLS